MQNQPGPPQYQPQPPSSMGHGVKIGIGIVIGVILITGLVLGACGVACVGLIGGGTALNRQNQPDTQAPTIGEVGQRIAAGDIALTIEKTLRAPSIDRYHRAGNGHVFIVTDVLIENTAKQNVSINVLSFGLKDGDGHEFSQTTTSSDAFLSLANLLPGDKLRSKIAFEVQQKPNSYVLTYAPLNLFGDDHPIRVAFKSE